MLYFLIFSFFLNHDASHINFQTLRIGTKTFCLTIFFKYRMTNSTMSSSFITCVEFSRADWANIGILLHTLPGPSISGVHQEEVPLSALYQTPVHILTQGVVAKETLANCHISFVIVHFTENQCILGCSHHWSKVGSDLHTRSLPVDFLFGCRSSLVEARW